MKKRRRGIAVTVAALLIWGAWVTRSARHRAEIPIADPVVFDAVGAHRMQESGNPLGRPLGFTCIPPQPKGGGLK